MKKIYYISVIFFLSLLSSSFVFALRPIEGIIFGNVEDIRQIDPLRGSLTPEYITGKETDENISLIDNYIGTFKQGTNLHYRCEKDLKLNYLTKWDFSSASRSIVSTLQYMGIDLTVKAIAYYAKKLEYTKDQYDNLTYNLINNMCSQNVSVYSIDLIRDNFSEQWKRNTFGELDLSQNPYFDDYIKKVHNRVSVVEREFDYTIRNFRAFCSWNGDTTDYRMLVPYLKSPYIMSYIFNHLDRKKIQIDTKTREVILKPNKNSIQVGCEDLVCRKRNEFEFNRVFPRMIGSTSLRDDLETIYCDHYANLRYKRDKANSKIIKWLDEQIYEEPKIEALNFLALLTKTPDTVVLADSYDEIEKFIYNNIKFRWDNWADKKVNKLSTEHLYEESLKIELVEQAGSKQVKNYGLNVLFDVGLSELDQVLVDVDKIDAKFNLSFIEKELAYYKERSRYFYNNSKYEKRQELLNQLVKNIRHQVRKREKYFKIPIWNEQMYGIIGQEVMKQLDLYRSRKFRQDSNQIIKIPVKFRFGVFALQYIAKKRKYLENSKKALTFN